MRPSQLLRDFGVGAVVDLPYISVMVLGVEEWDRESAPLIGEERLRRAVRKVAGPQVTELRAPPLSPEGDQPRQLFGGGPVGVPVAPFPRWMVCPYCHLLAPLESRLFLLKVQAYHPDRARYVHANCAKPGPPVPALPARFLAACMHGHLDDFPWVYYVHRGAAGACAQPRLKLREAGLSSDINDVRVECVGCGAQRRMGDAFGGTVAQSMPRCRGRRPHLRDFDDQECPERMKTLLLGATNSWFPVLLGALSIPREVDPLDQLVEANWHLLEKAESMRDVRMLRRVGLLPQLAPYEDDEALWDAIGRKRTGMDAGESAPDDLKAPEWRAFTQRGDVLDHPHFRTRAVPPPIGYEQVFARVVLAERLREVNALVGFTRLASPGDAADLDEVAELTKAGVSRRPPRWIPAWEVQGEGIFLQFDEAAIQRWLDGDGESEGTAATADSVREREGAFRVAHRDWRTRRRVADPTAHFPGLRYVLLHSFAHALMRQLAIEAGYSAASLAERVYSLALDEEGGPMAGVLIYTAAPDSEGTLGGLVSLGEPERLGHHLDAALESMRWCASDPLCAEHSPLSGTDALHGAACHACLFAPETSCERGNRYLDRSLLVPTLERARRSFFAV